MEQAFIELREIEKIYCTGDSKVRANDGINLKINQGEFLAVVGKSGSGKSTIMNIIGALDIPTGGTYILNGSNVGKMKENSLARLRNKTIGFIFQQYNLLPRQTVMENVELPLLYAGIGKKKRKEMAFHALERVELEEKAESYPRQLSGGQQQRAAIARALAGNPNLILADEPTGALDSKTGKEVLELLKDLNREGNTVILITHDSSIAEEADRIIQMYDGKVIFDGTAFEYSERQRESAYELIPGI